MRIPKPVAHHTADTETMSLPWRTSREVLRRWLVRGGRLLPPFTQYGEDLRHLAGIKVDAGYGLDSLPYPFGVGLFAELHQSVGDGLGLLHRYWRRLARRHGRHYDIGPARSGWLPGHLCDVGGILSASPRGDMFARFVGRLGLSVLSDVFAFIGACHKSFLRPTLPAPAPNGPPRHGCQGGMANTNYLIDRSVFAARKVFRKVVAADESARGRAGPNKKVGDLL